MTDNKRANDELSLRMRAENKFVAQGFTLVAISDATNVLIKDKSGFAAVSASRCRPRCETILLKYLEDGTAIAVCIQHDADLVATGQSKIHIETRKPSKPVETTTITVEKFLQDPAPHRAFTALKKLPGVLRKALAHG